MAKYRQNETWISNKFVGQLGIEAFMPNANMGLEEKGFKHVDIQRANRRMTCLRAMPKAWRAVAEQQENWLMNQQRKDTWSRLVRSIIGRHFTMGKHSFTITKTMP